MQFSEEMWERLSAMWRKERKQKEEETAYSDPQVRHLLKVMLASRRAMKEKQEFDTEEAWKMIRKRTGTRRLLPAWWRYAAAVVVLGIAIWFWHENRERAELPLAVNGTDTIRPGSQKAELILANGERIVLDAHTENREITGLGIIITNDTSDGKLRYEAGTKEDSKVMEYNTLIVPKGGEYSLILPDSSQVWLNSETTLRFPVQFAAHKREVELEGEAYFDVASDKKSPFVIHMTAGDICVLGTEFNVSAYAGENLSATLVQGSIRFDAGDGKSAVIRPEQHLTYAAADHSITVEEVDTWIYTSWRKQVFCFESRRLEEVFTVLARWYNVEVVYEDEGLKALKLSGSMDKYKDIRSFLQVFETGTDVKFDIRERKIIVKRK